MSLKDKTSLVIAFLIFEIFLRLYYTALNEGLMEYNKTINQILGFLGLGIPVSLLIFFLAILKKQKESDGKS